MKKVFIVNLVIAITLILGACGSSNHVVNNRLISKRKYTKGVFINKKSKLKNASKEELAENTIKPESQKARKASKKVTESKEKKNEVAANESFVVTEPSVIESEEPMIQEEVHYSSVSDNAYAIDDNEELNSTEIEEDYTVEVKELSSSKESAKNQMSDADGMFILAVVLAILIPFLGVLVYTNIDWMKVLICLLLTLLFFLPGMIYALLVVFDVI